ncbi:MAG: tripartite tricarboxylate transporter permease [Spirochaetales bacterium]
MDFVSLLTETIKTFGLFVFNLITWQNMLFLFGSMVVGITFGVLPGLSATVGIAMFTGLTYAMQLETALIVLMGVYIGAIYGGSISAILINIPGTGSAAATCLDGYPLAMKGESGNANTVARVASVIGTLFGMIIFLFFTPIMTKLALQFTSPEFFWLAVFGILICGAISAPGLVIKGWIAGFIGILMAMVGMEDLQGWERLTFGIRDLITGIPFVPMTIAFFGVPQIVKIMKQGETTISPAGKDIKKALPLASLIKENFIRILRWGFIGVGIGAVPGVGENIAAWVAYGDAKRTCKNGKDFGTGVYEGVMAPETANNAAIGGAIIPLISLGIPGSPPAAMLLGALMLHGIRPGPMLSVEHPAIIPQLGAIILWGTIYLFVIGIVITKLMVSVLKVSQKILIPIIAVLCVIGVYSYNLNSFHLALVFVCGILGYLLDKMNYSSAPLILGLILGNMADAFFRRALYISHGNIFSLINRPLSFIFFLACVLTIAKQFPIGEKVVNLFTKRKNN